MYANNAVLYTAIHQRHSHDRQTRTDGQTTQDDISRHTIGKYVRDTSRHSDMRNM